MAKVIGIDLGTTNSCVAVMEGTGAVTAAAVRVVPNAEGARTTPSVVAFLETGEQLVGQAARRQASNNPEHTVYSVKRLMGRKFDDEEVQYQRSLVPYAIIEAENGDAWVKAHERTLSPPEVSAIILRHMKEVAEAYLGEEVTDAVITVPAYFDDAQRQATKDAGAVAGLNVQRIINEPTAAALAYGLDRSEAQTILVYDLGGGTFDVSVMRIEDGVFRVSSTLGDTHLGGEDFDQRLVEVLLREFRTAHDIDLREFKLSLQLLKEAAERAKHELSSSLETEINLPFIATSTAGQPIHLQRSIKRNEFELLVADLCDRAIDLCNQAVTDAAISIGAIDTIVMVGGMTRMPAVQQSVEEFFGQKVSREVNPDEVVAIGATIQGAALAGDTDEVLLLDVAPLSIGVETGGGVMTPLITRNTTVPTSASEIFTTSVDNQSFVPVHVLQGERKMAADCRSLAQFELSGIPPAPRGVPKIQVTFNVDANGILQVEATDLGTGMTTEVSITPHSGLSESEIDQLVQAADQHREADELRSEWADLRNQSETLIYTTQQALEGYGDLVKPDLTELIEKGISVLRLRLDEAADFELVRVAHSELEAAAFRIAESMYDDI